MQIEFGEKIRELRKRDGRKQEDLAAALGVTKQAVSRWEANGGYPDMQMLPAIANYFHITIDELFGYDNDRQIRLQSYVNQADQIRNGGDIRQLLEFLRNAISEFPSEWRLQCRLANALAILGYQECEPNATISEGGSVCLDREKNAQNRYLKEAVSVYEAALKKDALEKDMDDGYRTGVIGALICLYSFIGDFENAEKTARSQSPIKISQEVLLARAAEGEKAEEYCGEAILALMHELYMVIDGFITAKHSLTYSQAALDAELAVARLYESILEDGNYGSFHNDICMLYLNCSAIAVRLNESEHALKYLEIALDHFMQWEHFSKSDQLRESHQLTAPLVSKVKSGATSFVVMNREWFEKRIPAAYVDTIRNNPKYALFFEKS
nr:helix-turn-helix transcriptional regulator [uncultured Acetatifactor sp.]